MGLAVCQVKNSRGKEEELEVFHFVYKLFRAVNFVFVEGTKRTICSFLPCLLASRMQLFV